MYALEPAGRKNLELSWICPPDKSITHRACMFAGLATGRSRITNPLLGEDCRATMAALEALGCTVDIAEDKVEITSPGFDHWKSPTHELDFCNSGTTTRLIFGLLSSLPGLEVTCIGDASLSQRPMRRVVEPLRAMGAEISGKDNGNLLPITIRGRTLEPSELASDKASAQVKSCIALAALNCSGETRIRLPAGSRDHTERFFSFLGVDFHVSNEQGDEILRVRGPFRPEPFSVQIPGDPSSAAFLEVAAVLLPEGRLSLAPVLSNKTRCGYQLAMESAGLKVESLELSDASYVEPVTKRSIEGGQIFSGFEIRSAQIPMLIDEIPILAVLAAFAKGPSRFYDLKELRVKESDRLAKTAELLELAGAKYRIDADDLIIEGGLERARSFEFDPAHDHRLAMAAAVMALRSEGSCYLTDESCVAVSFPGFFDLLNELR